MDGDPRIGEVIGQYRLLDEVGRGGMGIVFRAEQINLHRQVAIKMVPRHLAELPDIIARFKREALATARLSHSGIVQIHDYCEVDGRAFYVMEYLDPRTWTSLRDRLDREIIVPPDQSLELVLKMLDALQAAHGEGLIHRDLKPTNIMVSTGGEIKILDFGIAVLKGQTRLTMDGSSPSGTADYMSPEQGENKDIDQRSDIYAIGTMLFEMLTGELPFQADNLIALLRLRSEQEAPSVRQRNRDIPPEVEAIVTRAMARQPDHRYPSAAHMMTDIRRFIRYRPFAASPARAGEAEAELSHTSERVTLEVHREGNRFRVGLSHDGHSLETVSRYEMVDFSEESLDDWCSETRELIRKANAQGGGNHEQLEELKRVGQRMYDNLLPVGVKKALDTLCPKFLLWRLDDYAVRVPWELLFDGRQFLCRQFECARIISTSLEVGPAARRKVSSEVRMVVVGDPRGDLQAARDESVFLRDQFSRLPGVKMRLRQNRVTREQLERDLRESDILHYSGHAIAWEESDRESGWQLSDGTFGPSELRKLTGGHATLPVLIFANACASASVDHTGAEVEKHVYSLAKACLLAGVQNYVGTRAEVLDTHAAEFALTYYREVMRGRSLGDALRLAREHIVREFGEECLIWANYVMYGNPTRTLFPKPLLTEAPEADEAAAPEAPASAPALAAAGAESLLPSPTRARPPRRRGAVRMAGLVILLLAALFAGHAFLSDSPDHKSQAQNLLDIGKTEEALASFEKAANVDPSDTWCRYMVMKLRNQIDQERRQEYREQVRLALSLLEKEDPPENGTADADVWTSRGIGIAFLPAITRQSASFEGTPPPESDGDYFAFLLSDVPGLSGRFYIVDRSLLDVALTELALEQKGLTDQERSVRVGQLISARLLIKTTLFLLSPEKRMVSCQVIDTESSEVVTTFQKTIGGDLEEIAGQISEEIAASIGNLYPLRGRVSALTATGDVEVNLGQQHGVRSGMIFQILDNTSLSQPIGRLRITRASDAASLGSLIAATEDIEPGQRIEETLEADASP